jgi:urease accessory protein
MEPWALLQLADSAFPSDGFARAAGLDDAHGLGRVRTPDDVVVFAEETLWAAGTFGLPFVRSARADPGIHPAVDAVCDAALRSASANQASREQGQAFLRAAAIFSPAISRLSEEARRRGLAGHLAPAFGAVLGLLGADDDDACRLFVFLAARSIYAASVRLGVIGPIESQALLARTAPVVAAVLAAAPDAAASVAGAALHGGLTPWR